MFKMRKLNLKITENIILEKLYNKILLVVLEQLLRNIRSTEKQSSKLVRDVYQYT